MMNVRFSRKFSKLYAKSEPKIKLAFQERLKLFEQNPLDPLLNNHQLKGELKDFRSINISGDWRALYSERLDKLSALTITFEALGTHSQLYR